jgi:hypothetical protein
LDLGLDAAASSGPLHRVVADGTPVGRVVPRFEGLGFAEATGGDEVFRDPVLTRIIEPTSKLDSLRVLTGIGIAWVSYRTLKRRLPAYAEQSWRGRLAAVCARHAALGPASLVLYDVSTLYF